MSEPELKPCPFCGSDDLRVIDRDYEHVEYLVRCIDCECEGPLCDEDEEEAIEAWNMRDGEDEDG